MHQTLKTFTSEGADARKWFGRIIMAVVLGEAIWSLIVSVMNNLVVPWLGDVMGQSSGLPTVGACRKNCIRAKKPTHLKKGGLLFWPDVVILRRNPSLTPL